MHAVCALDVLVALSGRSGRIECIWVHWIIECLGRNGCMHQTHRMHCECAGCMRWVHWMRWMHAFGASYALDACIEYVSWRSCVRSLIYRKLRCDLHDGRARDRWRVTSCAATVIAAMRTIAYASQVAPRPPWRSCAPLLVHHRLRCDRHGGHARDRLCIARCAATVIAGMRAFAGASQATLRPPWRSYARSLMHHKL